MASSPQAVLCRYHYDPLDRLAGTTPAGQPDVLRFYHQNRLATEVHGAVKRTIVQHEDLLLAQQQGSDSAIETTLLATDQQRSVLHLRDNNDTHALAYNPYGHLPAESGISSLLGFNGEHRDPVTGHYLLGNGYRAFNPVLMRFNSPDSLSPFGEGGINAFAYCEGDPVNSLDPSGHIPFRTFTFPNRSFYGSAYSVRRLPSRLLSKGRDVTQFTGKLNRVSPRQSVDGRLHKSAAEVSVIQHTTSITTTSPGVKLVASGLATSHAPQTQMPVFEKSYFANRSYINRNEKAGFLGPDRPGTQPELEEKIETLKEVVRRGGELQQFFKMRVASASGYPPKRALKAVERYARITQAAQDFLDIHGNVSVIRNPLHL